MKSNYFEDENKYFDRPGRKYSTNETSYYHHRDEDRRSAERKEQKSRKEYVDFDDPNVNA